MLEKYPQQHNQMDEHIENGNHDVTNRSSITNGKFINNWRIQRCTDDHDHGDDGDDDGDGTNGNDTDASKLHHHTNGNGMNGGYTIESNGGHRSYFKRSSHSDNNNKYLLRTNGLRKSSAYFQENGTPPTRSEFHDIYENSTQHSQFR